MAQSIVDEMSAERRLTSIVLPLDQMSGPLLCYVTYEHCYNISDHANYIIILRSQQ